MPPGRASVGVSRSHAAPSHAIAGEISAARVLWSVRIVLLLNEKRTARGYGTDTRGAPRFAQCGGAASVRIVGCGLVAQGAVARAQRANVVPWIVCNSAASCCRNYA